MIIFVTATKVAVFFFVLDLWYVVDCAIIM